MRIVAILGAVLLAVTLSLAAASGGGASAVKEGGTFRVGVPETLVFDSIDPILSNYPAPGVVVFRATCAGLMMKPAKPYPAGLRLVPEIATDYPKITNGGKTYTFTIRKGARFSTRELVTARSFAHTINRLLNPKMNSWQAGQYSDIVGAQDVIAGLATEASGLVARGNTLTIRLTKAAGDFTSRIGSLCVVPASMPIDPEGARTPVSGAGPYYIAEYVSGRQVVLERNPYYKGERPQHVDRFVVELTGDPASALDRIERGELDYAWIPVGFYADRALEFRRKYGINKLRFFTSPAPNLRIFHLNTERPLFRNNVKLRQAVNFAVDREALAREVIGPLGGILTDRYIPPFLPGRRNERIYPLEGPNLAKAKALAKGNLRGGKAVLYVHDLPFAIAAGQVLKENLKKIGLDVEIVPNPVPFHHVKLGTRGEPFDIGFTGWIGADETILNFIFDGRTMGQPGQGNYSYFDSPKYNRLLERASRLPPGPERTRTYAALDVDIARNAAPAVAFAVDRVLTLVSKRTGCVVVNPNLDLAAVCLR